MLVLAAATLVLTSSAGPIRVIEESRGIEQHFDLPGDDSGRRTSCDANRFRIWIADKPAELARLRAWDGRAGQCPTQAVVDTAGALRVVLVPMAAGDADVTYADGWHMRSQTFESHLPAWYEQARKDNPEAYGGAEDETEDVDPCPSPYFADALQDGRTNLELLGFSPKGLVAYSVQGEIVIQDLTTDRIVERKGIGCAEIDRFLKSRQIAPLASRPTAWGHQTLVFDGDPLTVNVSGELKLDPAGDWLWHVQLVSRARGRKELGTIRRNDRPPPVAVVGFVVSPFEDRAAVIVETSPSGAPAVFGAHLTKGFSK